MPISKMRYQIVSLRYNAGEVEGLDSPMYTDMNGTQVMLFDPNGYSSVESALEAINEKDAHGDYAVVLDRQLMQDLESTCTDKSG